MTKETLPSRIGARDLIDFLEKVVYHPGSSENELKKRVQNAKEIAALKRCALLLRFINEDGGALQPTDLATRFVFADQSERKDIMFYEVVQKFDLYAIPLEHVVSDRSEPFNLTSSEFQKYWTINTGLKLSKDTLDRSTNTMFKLFEFAGLGTYYIGRRGKPTRLEITTDGLDRIHEAYSRHKEVKKQRIMGEPENIPQDIEIEQVDSTHVQLKPDMTTTVDKKQQQHQTHMSKDGSVYLKIVPSEKSIKFLELIIPVLKLELEEDDE